MFPTLAAGEFKRFLLGVQSMKSDHHWAPAAGTECVDVVSMDYLKEILRLRCLRSRQEFLQAASFGVCIKDSVLYCTHQPCVTCSKMIINAGITEVIYGGDYPDKLAVAMLKEAKVKLTRFKC